MQCDHCNGTGRVAIGPIIGWSPDRGMHATARDEYGWCTDCEGSGIAPDENESRHCLLCEAEIEDGDVCMTCILTGSDNEAPDGGDEESPREA